MEYRSSARLLGLPLVHVVTGSLVNGRYRRGVATAWIAVGDVAIGVLFSCGGVALGGISLGGVALGLLPIGGLALGVLAVGGLALGMVAIGGGAIAWHAAVGGLAIAHEYASGGLAIARHVIVPPASGSLPLSAMPWPEWQATDALVLAAILLAILFAARSVQRRRQQQSPLP